MTPYYHRRGIDRIPTHRHRIGERLVISIHNDQSSHAVLGEHLEYSPCVGTNRCAITTRQNGAAIIRLGDPYQSNTPKITTFEGAE